VYLYKAKCCPAQTYLAAPKKPLLWQACAPRALRLAASTEGAMAVADAAHELPPDALWQRIEAACSRAEAQGVAYKCAAQRFLLCGGCGGQRIHYTISNTIASLRLCGAASLRLSDHAVPE